MNLNKDLQKLNNRLDKSRVKLAAAELRQDTEIVAQFKREIEQITKNVEAIKGQISRENASKSSGITSMAFNRALTKAEQADMGKLKKSVRGLVVVHPMTAVGKEIGVSVVTGYAPKPF